MDNKELEGMSREEIQRIGRWTRAVLAREEMRISVREGLRARGLLPSFSRERAAAIIDAYLAEQELKESSS